ncbi:MAG: hypothetical protein AAF558_07120 [Verrucomicrobiota bacterium]
MNCWVNRAGWFFLWCLTLPCDAFDPMMGDPFTNPLIIEIQGLHDSSARGDKVATDQLVTKLETLIESNPENQLLRVYLGSAYTLKSRDAFPGPSKMRYLKDGLKTMDDAVKRDPDNICVRFVRAVNNFHLPAFINRRDNARKDFEQLLLQIQSQPQNLNLKTVQAIHYFAGLSYKQTKRSKEAREAWLKGIQMSSDSVLTQKMEKELERLKI